MDVQVVVVVQVVVDVQASLPRRVTECCGGGCDGCTSCGGCTDCGGCGGCTSSFAKKSDRVWYWLFVQVTTWRTNVRAGPTASLAWFASHPARVCPTASTPGWGGSTLPSSCSASSSAHCTTGSATTPRARNSSTPSSASARR